MEGRVNKGSVAAVEGAADGGGGEVRLGGGGIGGSCGGKRVWMKPFLGGGGAVEAVRENGGRVALAAEAGLDEVAAVV
ncbi:hypothetical protein PIB30_024820 [Stylosanthes scabra]|uniref:Uncharacterized protein n=1 Tax=Stylosanthes scabra TaxID=79078 RepID=A0ABU6XAT7_9FABA|nr:hypothetical protein [Stylosanthes scabra]